MPTTAPVPLTVQGGQLLPDPAATPSLFDTGEYGRPEPNTASGRYNWLGAKQRSAETVGNSLILMGVRLYNPVTGRFLQIDPVPGGSANAYEYCTADPINCADLDGARWG